MTHSEGVSQWHPHSFPSVGVSHIRAQPHPMRRNGKPRNPYWEFHTLVLPVPPIIMQSCRPTGGSLKRKGSDVQVMQSENWLCAPVCVSLLSGCQLLVLMYLVTYLGALCNGLTLLIISKNLIQPGGNIESIHIVYGCNIKLIIVFLFLQVWLLSFLCHFSTNNAR